MTGLFWFCVIVGGTLLLCQLAMTLMGFIDMGELSDVDIPDDVGSGDSGPGEAGASEGSSGESHSSKVSWLFGILSFQTLVAAMTFFGLAGMAVNRAGGSSVDQVLVAAASGLAAMYGVHWLMRSLHSLGQSGTLSMTHAIGLEGTTTLRIPADGRGRGKVLLQIQGRLEELPAITRANSPIPTGQGIHVIGLADGNVLEVMAGSAVPVSPVPKV